MSDQIIFSLIFIFSSIILIKIYRIWKEKNTLGLHEFAKQIAASHSMQLSITDHFQEKTLGFDVIKNKALYIDLRNNIIQAIEMSDVHNCKLIKKQLSTQMELIYHNQDKAPLTITFFDKFRDRRWRRNKLEKKALYWEVLMNGILNKTVAPAESLSLKDFE